MNESQLKKMKKDDLIAMILELNSENEMLKDDSKMAEKIDELQGEIEDQKEIIIDLESDLESKDDEIEELENYKDKFSLDFAYELRNAIDDILNNVTRETLWITKRDLQVCYDRLDVLTGGLSVDVLPLVV